eukprot:47506_1
MDNGTSLQRIPDEGQNSHSPSPLKRDGTASKSIFMAWDGFLGLSQLTWNLFFVFLVVFGMVGQNVTLPIWFASAPTGELDPYFILTFAGMTFCFIFGMLTIIDITKGNTTIDECKFFTTKSFIIRCFLIGFCNALNGLLLVFAAPPTRTPTFLQAILGTFNIAWTILFRCLILHKYPTKMQFIWAGGVFIGLFLASCPSVFGLDSGSSFTSQAIGAWKVMWPVIFASSFAPAAIMNVVGEEVLKETSESRMDRDKILHINDNSIEPEEISVNVWYYLTVQSIAQLFTFICCFWVCIIPNFGTVNTIPEIFDSLKQDWRYFFAMDGATWECSFRAIVFIGCYILNYIGSSLMLRYTEGATWTAIVAAMVTPLGGIFWFFFEIQKHTNVFKTYWNWDNSDIFIIIGLFVMAPFIYLYDNEVQKEQDLEKEALDYLNQGEGRTAGYRILDDDNHRKVIL